MSTLSFSQAFTHLKENGYKAHVNMQGEDFKYMELIHPERPTARLRVHHKAAKKLIPMCYVIGSENTATAIMVLDDEKGE